MTDYMKERIASFEAENPSIKIELKVPANYQTSSGEYWNALDAADKDQLPDVFVMNAPHFSTYQAEGKLLSIDDLLSTTTEINMSALPQSLTDIYKSGSRQYGIPIDYDTIGLWYNKTLFDQAGISYPNRNWTWSDLLSAAEKIDALQDDIYGFIAGDVGQLGYYNTIAGCGGYVVKDGKFGLDDEKTQAGIQAWVDASKYSPSLDEISNSGGPHMLFMKGKVGMTFGGDWEAADFTSADSAVADVINVTELPLMPNGNRASVIHGKANVISASTKHHAEAKKFLEYLSSAESYEKLAETGVCIVAHSTYAKQFFTKYEQYDMGIFAREATECSAPYPSSVINNWEEQLNAAIAEMLNGDVSVKDGCERYMNSIAEEN